MRNFSEELRFFGDFAQAYDLEYENYTQDLDFWLNQVKEVDKVLEIAVGTGRVTIPLAKECIKVVGIDISEEMLKVAEEKFDLLPKAIRDNIELCCADMREFNLRQKFLLVIVPFSAFQHMLTNNDIRLALRCFCNHLESGGRLIIDCFNPDIQRLARRSQSGGTLYKTSQLTDGRWLTRIDLGRYDPVKQIVSVTLISDFSEKEGSGIKRYIRKIDLRVFFPQELVALVENEGFRVLNVLGDFDQAVLSEHSRRLIIIGQKT